MLGRLLESGARAPRRSGGAILSVAAHIAIVGAAVGATAAHAKPKKGAEPVRPMVFKVLRAVVPPETRRSSSGTASSSAGPALPNVTVHHVDVPTFTPTTIAPVDLTHGLADSIVIGTAGNGVGHLGHGLLDGDARGSSESGEWRADELLMHLTRSSRPYYPEALRQAGVDGRVLVRFVVDTTGRIDMSSVRFVSSTHDLFSQAVKSALPTFRFRPAEAGGRKVPALAEMPFEFTLGR